MHREKKKIDGQIFTSPTFGVLLGKEVLPLVIHKLSETNYDS